MRVSIVKASKLTLARPDFSFRLFHEATLRLLRELSLLPTYSCSCFRLQSTRIWAGVIRRGFIPLLGYITVINLSDYFSLELRQLSINNQENNVRNTPATIIAANQSALFIVIHLQKTMTTRTSRANQLH